MNIIRPYILFISMIFLFSGCSSIPIKTLKQDQDVLNNAEKQGYIVLGVNSDFSISSIVIEGESDFVIDSSIPSEGRSYFIAPVPKGKYKISRISLSRIRYFDLDFEEFSFSFSIEPNKINYVGELSLRNASGDYAYFELVNRSSLALEFLELKYPTILSNKSLIYKGPGKDSFFELVSDKKRSDIQEGSL